MTKPKKYLTLSELNELSDELDTLLALSEFDSSPENLVYIESRAEAIIKALTDHRKALSLKQRRAKSKLHIVKNT